MVVSFLGMYPQTVVPSTDILHTTLTNGTDGTNQVTKLEGVYYTANKDNLAWNPNDRDTTEEKNEVYEYKGDRYVRVTPYALLDQNSLNKYNNGNPIGQVAAGTASYRWFKVEPIKWIVLNKDVISDDGKIDTELNITTDLAGVPIVPQGATLELYAADVLMGGIPFGVAEHTSWEGSIINQYLNNAFFDEAFSRDDKLQIQTSTIYNNRKAGEDTISSYTIPAFNSSLNHLIDGSGENETVQKIYLLSRYELSEVTGPYVGAGKVFTNDTNRQIDGTDYARAHNLWLSAPSNGKFYPYYWTRTAQGTANVYCVTRTGGIGSYHSTPAYYGTRPALQLK